MGKVLLINGADFTVDALKKISLVAPSVKTSWLYLLSDADFIRDSSFTGADTLGFTNTNDYTDLVGKKIHAIKMSIYNDIAGTKSIEVGTFTPSTGVKAVTNIKGVARTESNGNLLIFKLDSPITFNYGESIYLKMPAATLRPAFATGKLEAKGFHFKTKIESETPTDWDRYKAIFPIDFLVEI